MTRSRVNDQPGWLGENDYVLVLVENVQGTVLGLDSRVLGRSFRTLTGDPRGLLQAKRGLAYSRSVHCHTAFLDPPLDLVAGDFQASS